MDLLFDAKDSWVVDEASVGATSVMQLWPIPAAGCLPACGRRSSAN